MNADEFDKILVSEKEIEASPSFTRDVMMRVEAEASHRHQVLFSWTPFVVFLVLAITTLWILQVERVLQATYWMSYTLGEWIIAPPEMIFGNALLTALASILGTFLLVWISLRLVDAGD